MEKSCSHCAVKACEQKAGDYPDFCPTDGLESELLQKSLEITAVRLIDEI